MADAFSPQSLFQVREPEVCSCGSGRERFALADARGIFCGYACLECEAGKRSAFRPEIFSDSQYEADDLGDDEDFDDIRDVEYEERGWDY